MRASRPARPHDYSAQLIIATFDKWQDLSSALEPIRAEEGCCFRAVLNARNDLPEDPRQREAVNEIAELEYNASKQRMAASEERSPAPWRRHSARSALALQGEKGRQDLLPQRSSNRSERWIS
jgi:hypothetical protein